MMKTPVIALLSFVISSYLNKYLVGAVVTFDIDIEGVEHELGFNDIDFSNSLPKGRDLDILDGNEQAAMMRVVAALREARLNSEKNHAANLKGESAAREGINSSSSLTDTVELKSNVSVQNYVHESSSIRLRQITKVIVAGALAAIASQPFQRLRRDDFISFYLFLNEIRDYSSLQIVLQKLLTKFKTINFPTIKSGAINLLRALSTSKSKMLSIPTHVQEGALKFAVIECLLSLLRSTKSPIRRFGALVDFLASSTASLAATALWAVLNYHGARSWEVMMLDLVLTSVSYTMFHFQKRVFFGTERKTPIIVDLFLAGTSTALAVGLAFSAKLLSGLESSLVSLVPSVAVLYAVYEFLKNPSTNVREVQKS